MVSISIISHNQAHLLNELILQLLACPEISKIIVTLNTPEPYLSIFSHRKVYVMTNDKPKGYGENHNTAFKDCNTPYFCVLNPDIVLTKNPFSKLLQYLSQNKVSLIAPLIINKEGRLEDSFRCFPSFKKVVLRRLGFVFDDYKFDKTQTVISPEWIAGMFMLFNSTDYKNINGFDERFFMYCEDVDICLKLSYNNRKFVVLTSLKVQHNAQRYSKKKIKFFIMHVRSLLFLWSKYPDKIFDAD